MCLLLPLGCQTADSSVRIHHTHWRGEICIWLVYKEMNPGDYRTVTHSSIVYITIEWWKFKVFVYKTLKNRLDAVFSGITPKLKLQFEIQKVTSISTFPLAWPFSPFFLCQHFLLLAGPIQSIGPDLQRSFKEVISQVREVSKWWFFMCFRHFTVISCGQYERTEWLTDNLAGGGSCVLFNKDAQTVTAITISFGKSRCAGQMNPFASSPPNIRHLLWETHISAYLLEQPAKWIVHVLFCSPFYKRNPQRAN